MTKATRWVLGSAGFVLVVGGYALKYAIADLNGAVVSVLMIAGVVLVFLALFVKTKKKGKEGQ